MRASNLSATLQRFFSPSFRSCYCQFFTSIFKFCATQGVIKTQSVSVCNFSTCDVELAAGMFPRNTSLEKLY